MRTGFEPVNVALRGQCVKPLHQQTSTNTVYHTFFNLNKKTD